MPCYRCGVRQADPDRGESLWRRAVQGSRHVLVCPGCQLAADWTADLDRCHVCSSVRLVRRLGETECRDCGAVSAAAGSAAPGSASASGAAAGGCDVPPGLAAEVEEALARVLGRAGRAANRG